MRPLRLHGTARFFFRPRFEPVFRLPRGCQSGYGSPLPAAVGRRSSVQERGGRPFSMCGSGGSQAPAGRQTLGLDCVSTAAASPGPGWPSRKLASLPPATRISTGSVGQSRCTVQRPRPTGISGLVGNGIAPGRPPVHGARASTATWQSAAAPLRAHPMNDRLPPVCLPVQVVLAVLRHND